MSRFASFLAGFGKGYVGAKDKERQNARQDRLDQMQTDLHGLTLQKAAREKKTQDDLASAAATRVQLPQSAYSGVEGDVPAALPGQVFVGQDVDVTKANSGQAVNERMVNALRTNGDWRGAMTMQGQLQQQQLNEINLKNAHVEQARNEYNARVGDVLASNGGNVYATLAQMLSESQIGPLKGVSYAPKVSKDGKTVDLVATAPNGSQRTVHSFANNPSGELAVYQVLSKAKPETLVQWRADRLKQQQDEALRTRQLDQADTRLVIDAAQADNTRDYQTTMSGIAQQNADTNADNSIQTKLNAMANRKVQASQERRAQEAHDAKAAIKLLPEAAKTKLDLLKARIQSIQSQVAKAQAEGMAKGDGVAALNAQLEALTKQYATLVNVYLMPQDFKAPDLGLDAGGKQK